jgi:hypothetical protein
MNRRCAVVISVSIRWTVCAFGVSIRGGQTGNEIVGVLNFCRGSLLDPDEIGLSDEAFHDLGLPESAQVNASLAVAPASVDLVRAKLAGDIEGVEHSVEVTADSLYEAVARGLAALRDADWAGDIGHGQTTITVVVKQPEVEHKVRMRDFEAWLESNGRSPAEMALKSRLRELQSK